MYAATSGPNVKWGAPISNGGDGNHWPPAGDDSGGSASNTVAKRSAFVNQRCAECVCLYTMDFVSAVKKTFLFYVTVCDKVVPRLNKTLPPRI